MQWEGVTWAELRPFDGDWLAMMMTMKQQQCIDVGFVLVFPIKQPHKLTQATAIVGGKGPTGHVGDHSGVKRRVYMRRHFVP